MHDWVDHEPVASHMGITLAFDVYGTLIDTAGVVTAVEEFAGDRSAAFSHLWREKQLEYSFRRGLMQNYQRFKVCTENALDYTCAYFHIELTRVEKAQLMAAYRVLPAFADARRALEALSSSHYRLFAFSNGHADDVNGLLRHAAIDHYFEAVVSVDEIRSFKPNPAVYGHFLRRSGATGAEAWLVSSNPFDVIGAVSAGMRAAWVKRSAAAIFDPWDIQPSITVNSLNTLEASLAAFDRRE